MANSVQARVKLANSQLKKLWSAAKYKAGTTLNLRRWIINSWIIYNYKKKNWKKKSFY